MARRYHIDSITQSVLISAAIKLLELADHGTNHRETSRFRDRQRDGQLRARSECDLLDGIPASALSCAEQCTQSSAGLSFNGTRGKQDLHRTGWPWASYSRPAAGSF